AGWKSYVAEMLPLLQSQESKILIPAAFFEPRWQD
ncbi:NIPSNAP family protein, partial [Mycobacterium tuberculosis]